VYQAAGPVKIERQEIAQPPPQPGTTIGLGGDVRSTWMRQSASTWTRTLRSASSVAAPSTGPSRHQAWPFL